MTNQEFKSLCASVHACRICSRMDERTRVFGEACGPADAPLMFIGEAPGRLGADKSGIPFHGDRSGHNFEELLEFAHLSRHDIFVTNAVLCNPRDDDGRNATPTSNELTNCARFLERQIGVIKPQIVVTLGASALRSVGLIEAHNLSLSNDVRTTHQWYGRVLIPLYHPGQRAMVHRSLANQRSDYAFVAKHFRSLGKGRKSKAHTPSKERIAQVAGQIIKTCGGVSYFALHKLFYLFEYRFFMKYGERYTDAYIVRQLDGPYCTDLHVVRLQKRLPSLSITKKGDELIMKIDQNTFEFEVEKAEGDEPRVCEVLAEIAREYGSKTNAELKTFAYMTTPMRAILRLEKNEHRALYNSPIRFSESSRSKST